MALSLYAPYVAKILAYADCSVIMLTHGSPQLCDCNVLVTQEELPASPPKTDKEKELSIKTDWKYVAESAYRAALVWQYLPALDNLHIRSLNPRQFSQSVFHPPKV